KLVRVNKGDIVTCYIPYLDISVQARVIDFEKDLLTSRNISIELGNVVNNFIKDQADIQQRVNSILNSQGQVKADMLNGTINALQTQFKALRDVAQPQEVLAMMFEDRVENSPTFGAMAIGTMGFMIANKFKPNTQDWDFRTFGTGAGFVADFITAGILNANLIKTGAIRSADGKVNINIDNGAFMLSNDQGTVIIDGQHNIHKIINEGTTVINFTGQNETVTIPHNLGFKPSFSAYQIGAGGRDEYTSLPALTWSDGEGIKAIIRARADSQNLYFDFLKMNNYTLNNVDIQIKYFIYKEVAF
ncbi:MAG: hypothetical protein ACI33I_07310, partial [Clostridium sp.]